MNFLKRFGNWLLRKEEFTPRSGDITIIHMGHEVSGVEKRSDLLKRMKAKGD